MKILIIDDHQMFLEGISHVLQSGLGADVEILKAHDSATALIIINRHTDLDLILIDLGLPNIDGLALLQTLQERHILIPAIVLSGTDDIRKISAALARGALGFIPKSHNSEQMLNAINQVIQGREYLPDPLLRNTLERLRREQNKQDSATQDTATQWGITTRQLEVLKLLAKGFSNKAIADTLFISENTVKSHLRTLFELFGVNSRIECLRQAENKGLLDSQQD